MTSLLPWISVNLSSSRSQVPSIIWIKSIPLISHLLKVVRIFTSSTFTDMLMERNTLMEYVYPKIKEYCREKHGLEYQVVDMRWGVRSIVPSDSCHVWLVNIQGTRWRTSTWPLPSAWTSSVVARSTQWVQTSSTLGPKSMSLIKTQ